MKAFHFFLLAMESGVLGVFLATDLFLFYLFWELQVVPMFFLIGIWGHENRIFATIKFVLFSIAGSLLDAHCHHRPLLCCMGPKPGITLFLSSN